MSKAIFEEYYKKLNLAQREAVDTIEGPVMVIAGPGTGKTQVLTLRIANILKKTDTPASGILALTFTNSGVRAMRERLHALIGSAASHVSISTFHSFGISLIGEFYEDLGLDAPPELLDEKGRVVLFDELFEEREWKHLRIRQGGEHNFEDLKSLISFLRQEEISPEDFIGLIKAERKRIADDPNSLSTRGPTKGQMKVTEKEKLERFLRTEEAGAFYAECEKAKKERNLMDYDDVLEYMVKLVRRSDNARDTLRERYLYVLVDEHQDSSGVQNRFLAEVWAGVERPNIFAVGDDRQLIYSFGGASLSEFEKFRETFAGTQLIVLAENYRSTQTILDAAHALLPSSLVKEPLVGRKGDRHPLRLIEAEYPRDEILRAGLDMKERIKNGLPPEECTLLVPKRAQVKGAITILRDLGLPVASGGKASFFSLSQTQSLLAFLRVLASPYEPSTLCTFLLDPYSGVGFADAQRFLKVHARHLSQDDLRRGEGTVKELFLIIDKLLKEALKKDVYAFIQEAGSELFFKRAKDHRALLTEIEVVRTMLHLALSSLQKNPKESLSGFLTFLERLEAYGEDVPLAVFEADKGVKVMTLHASKGLEFEYVWIAHLDESSLMKGRSLRITLPESLKDRLSKKDELSAKRELYVGMTRARSHCTLSYARSGYEGGDQKLAAVVAEMPEGVFEKSTASETEAHIRGADPLAYVASTPLPISTDVRKEIVALTRAEFASRPVTVTQLNNFWGCPWKWYFRNFLALPEAETESLKFGNVIHSAVERILHDGGIARGIGAYVNEALDRMNLYNERERQRLGRDAEEVLTRFGKKYLPSLLGHRSETKLRPYRDPDIPAIEVTGKIDLIGEASDGTLVVTDLKTGKVKTASEIEKRTEDGRMSGLLRQLAMYVYLLQSQEKSVCVSSARLLFLEAKEGEKGEVYQIAVGTEEIALLRKDLKDYADLLLSGKWLDLPCDFKPFGRQKECEYCRLGQSLIIGR